MRGFLAAAVVFSLLLLPGRAALATESAFGRYIPGLFAGPASQIVPPVPGFYWQSSTFFYKASAGKSFRGPFGGELRSGLKINFFSTSLSGIWVPDILTPGSGPNLALGLTIPLQSLRVEGDLGRFSAVDHSDGLGDILITPAVGWQNGPHLLSLNLGIYAPTGNYKAGALANRSQGCWTFSPSLAYAYINPAAHVDFSFVGGLDINTKNHDTDYRSGAMAHVDATLLYLWENGLGAGVFGSVLYQVADDQGPLADRLDGFRGRSFAVGPMIKYSGQGPHAATINFNWAPEFGVKNRLKGNAFYLNMTGRF